jgi:uncharacterized membrane protein
MKKEGFGQRAADKLTGFIGSWTFILLLNGIFALWIILNVIFYIEKWDPYPFILLNLVVGVLAAVQAPVIMMSQNRQEQRDRIRAEYDYEVNRKAEKEIREIKEQLVEIKKMLRR